MTVLERLYPVLETLSLSQIATVLDDHLDRAAKEDRPYAEFLCELLEAEVTARHDRHLQTRLKLAHLPSYKPLESFDFSFQPSLDVRPIRELQTLRFVVEPANVILLGPPGVGKTRPNQCLHFGQVCVTIEAKPPRSPISH